MSDSTHKGPDVSKVPHVGSARPSAPPPPRAEAATPAAPPRPSEQKFRQSLAGLSRSLGARAAKQPDPVAEAAARHAIVQAQIRAEDRRLKRVLGIAGAAVAAACIAAAIVFIAAPFGPRAAAPAVEARAQPLAVEPAPSLPPVSSPPVSSPPVSSPPEQTRPGQTAPVQAAAEPAAPPPASEPPPLAREEIKEIQARLASSGFNAGPADGTVGRLTESAIANYRQKRGLAQTGKPDRALLDQLRQEPPPAARRPSPPPSQAQPQSQPRSTAAASQRRNDGLDFVRDADARLSRWFRSLSN